MDVKEVLTPNETEELRKFIKENRHFPAKIGYILLEEKPLHPGLIMWLLVSERFDDIGIAMVFLGGMSENAARLLLEHYAKWDAGRIDRAITKAKLYYFYYSRFEQ
ncbi:MAG: hypothetical protein AAB797_03390 [Patescibacteria group bacterium]